jgi:hypothetical protein
MEVTTPDISALRQINTEWEKAVQNSNLPETQALAWRFQQAMGGATFHDLDVIADSEL